MYIIAGLQDYAHGCPSCVDNTPETSCSGAISTSSAQLTVAAFISAHTKADMHAARLRELSQAMDVVRPALEHATVP